MWSDWLVFCDCGFHLSPLWWRRIRGLWKLPAGRDWLWGRLDIVLMGGAILSKSSNFLLMSRVVSPLCCLAWSQTVDPLETPRHSQASLTQSLVGTLLLSPGSPCTQSLVCALQKSVSPVMWKFCNQIPLASRVKFPGAFQSLCWIPRLGNLLWVLELS